jgi:hypothetical protein
MRPRAKPTTVPAATQRQSIFCSPFVISHLQWLPPPYRYPRANDRALLATKTICGGSIPFSIPLGKNVHFGSCGPFSDERAWSEAFRRQDIEAIMAMLTPDYVLWAPGVLPQNADGLRPLFAAAFAACKVNPTFECDERWVAECRSLDLPPRYGKC